jgi:hypothetical protein
MQNVRVVGKLCLAPMNEFEASVPIPAWKKRLSRSLSAAMAVDYAQLDTISPEPKRSRANVPIQLSAQDDFVKQCEAYELTLVEPKMKESKMKESSVSVNLSVEPRESSFAIQSSAQDKLNQVKSALMKANEACRLGSDPVKKKRVTELNLLYLEVKKVYDVSRGGVEIDGKLKFPGVCNFCRKGLDDYRVRAGSCVHEFHRQCLTGDLCPCGARMYGLCAGRCGENFEPLFKPPDKSRDHKQIVDWVRFKAVGFPAVSFVKERYFLCVYIISNVPIIDQTEHVVTSNGRKIFGVLTPPTIMTKEDYYVCRVDLDQFREGRLRPLLKQSCAGLSYEAALAVLDRASFHGFSRVLITGCIHSDGDTIVPPEDSVRLLKMGLASENNLQLVTRGSLMKIDKVSQCPNGLYPRVDVVNGIRAFAKVKNLEQRETKNSRKRRWRSLAFFGRKSP